MILYSLTDLSDKWETCCNLTNTNIIQQLWSWQVSYHTITSQKKSDNKMSNYMWISLFSKHLDSENRKHFVCLRQKLILLVIIFCAIKCDFSIWVDSVSHSHDLIIILTELLISKISIFNHTFYLISYLISVFMTSIRQSNRAFKSRDYWNLTNSFSHWSQQSAFIIYIKLLKNLSI